MLVFRAIIERTSLRARLDFAIHFLGGVAIAYFIFHAVECLETVVGKMSSTARFLFSFGWACTIGLFWEIGERYSDVWFRTRRQLDLRETMSDLTADAAGAAFVLTLILLLRWFRGRRGGADQ